jgi:matrixin
MILRRYALATTALAGTLALLLPTPSRGFTVFGDTLDLSQRDFRIWNNFSDPEANDNLATDPDFPGARGATLAIWKGVAEWGSAPHGSGTTDPTQAVIGSGNSNFDAFFSAHSEGPGNKNANVISQIDGSAFIKASTDIPIRDGWRIRFYENPWVWNDGPDAGLQGGSDAWDLQGVAAHEFGHALGLDHSTDPDATMAAGSANKGLDFRSIEADDIAGVQFLYGVRAPQKPLIEGYELLPGGQVLLLGRSFHPAKNEVWFTHRGLVTGPDGAPVKVIDVPSFDGGSRLIVSVPLEAGPGDIAIRKLGFQFSDLSNSFPFDPQRDLLCPPLAYGQAKLTSLGTLPELVAKSLPSEEVGSLTLEVTQAIDGPAVVLVSDHRDSLPFLGGDLLVGLPLQRAASFTLTFGQGAVDLDVPAGTIGVSRYYQVWFRDPGASFASGLTGGLRVTTLP